MTQDEIDDKIKALLDKEFLDRLSEIARLYGWIGDFIEIASFIDGLYDYHGIERVDLEPYKTDD